ncbi:DUF3138 family protein [Pararobbsia alpina]|uniref:DUF3138 family protein n=1 Tax=Pararobbsia alpina TaxID=621374 RepID=A0A6S7BB21_9BURK|nr:DUF3138 family protein [Pararobbsia alpina]CAB3785081.1 hypothetical protein LMG28138_01951 [Pararobbsia alpina]
MKKKLICLLVAATVPGLAMADSTSSEIKELKAQLAVLQKKVDALEHAQAAAPVTAPAATAAVTAQPGTPEYDNAPANLTNAQVDQMKEQVANQQLKVDTLNDAAQTGPLAGLSVTGYLDPTYIYNRAQSSSSFLFANHDSAYQYYNSTFGDLYLDIKKTFGVGPMAPSAEITLMPNRGNGITLLTNEHGDIGNNILNTAVINVPVTAEWTAVFGLIPSFGGYEVQQSNLMNTLTHNLLYDFSDPGSYIGAGANYTKGDWAWKFFVGNEQYRTYGSITQTGVNQFGDPITTSNKIPTLTGRVDYTANSRLDIGGSFNIGRQTLGATPATDDAGNPIPVFYGPGGLGTSSAGTFVFGEVDMTYTTADWLLNAELDYGQQEHAAFNGGQAQWYGLSLQAHKGFTVPTLGRMGWTARYDYLGDHKNGGGGGGIALDGLGGDPYNGFGISRECLANSVANGGNGSDCSGANRQDVAFDLLFYPTNQITVKMEYRHDWASQNVFLRADGSYSKSNDLLGTQLIYSF